MDMNGQWPVSPWDFASGPSRSYSQPARSPILHRSPLTSQCVPWWMPHMWIGTLCSTPNHAKSPTCQRLSCVKCNTLPRDSLHHFLYWSSEDFWNRSIQGGTTNYAVSLSLMASWIWKAFYSSLRVRAMHQVAGLVRFSQPRAHVSLFSPPSLLLESHKKGLGPTASDRWKLLTF